MEKWCRLMYNFTENNLQQPCRLTRFHTNCRHVLPTATNVYGTRIIEHFGARIQNNLPAAVRKRPAVAKRFREYAW